MISSRVRIFSALYYRLAEVLYRLKGRQKKFTELYHKRGWGGSESVSGPGSSLEHTLTIREELPRLLKEINAHSLLDAPCGDFHWMKELQLDIDRYTGVDIVPEIISINREKYGNDRREFLLLDIVKHPLPVVDLVLCRDCFVHFSFHDIFRALKNICRSNSRYLLTTTFTDLRKNRDIPTGGWRPLNLQIPPFNFPDPISLINEKYTETDGSYADKSLALWDLGTVAHNILTSRQN